MEAQRTLKWLQRTGGVSHLVENSANQKYNGTPQEKSQIPPKQLLQVSSHRVLLKKGAICWGHPMSSHGVLGGKTGAISPRHLTPVSVLSPPPADTWDKLINTRHQHRHDRHNMDFLGNHKPADKKVGVWIAPSHEYLQKVAQSKVIQSKSWQQLRLIRSQVNARFCCVGRALSYKNLHFGHLMLWHNDQDFRRANYWGAPKRKFR